MEVQPGLSTRFADGYGNNPGDTPKLAKVAKDGGENFDRLFSYEDIQGMSTEQIIKEIEKPQQYKQYKRWARKGATAKALGREKPSAKGYGGARPRHPTV